MTLGTLTPKAVSRKLTGHDSVIIEKGISSGSVGR